MKRFTKILALLLIVSVVPVSAATYQLVSANYPILLNGSKLSVQPLNYNGTTYLPLRSISEAVGVPIEWKDKSVQINTLDVEKLKESCVMITALSSSAGSQGSAVCWDYGEYITAYHVVDNGQTDIKTSKGDVLKTDKINPLIDIATLDAPDNANPVKIGDSNDVKVGDKIVIIGSPAGEENTVTWATVTKNTYEIAVSGEIGSGASGSAAFDSSGNLIGIVIEVDEELNETYLTPINAIRRMF